MKKALLLVFLFFAQTNQSQAAGINFSLAKLLGQQLTIDTTEAEWVFVEQDNDEKTDDAILGFSRFCFELIDVDAPPPPCKEKLVPLAELITLPGQERIQATRKIIDKKSDQWRPIHHEAFAGNKDFFESYPQPDGLLILSTNGFSPLHMDLTTEGTQPTAHEILRCIKNQACELAILTQQSNFHALAPLHLALMLSDFDLIKKITSRLFFLAEGHNTRTPKTTLSVFNQTAALGITPLHIACILKNRLYIALLVAAGANPGNICYWGNVPANYLPHELLREELERYADDGG